MRILCWVLTSRGVDIFSKEEKKCQMKEQQHPKKQLHKRDGKHTYLVSPSVSQMEAAAPATTRPQADARTTTFGLHRRSRPRDRVAQYPNRSNAAAAAAAASFQVLSRVWIAELPSVENCFRLDGRREGESCKGSERGRLRTSIVCVCSFQRNFLMRDSVVQQGSLPSAGPPSP